jgi:hypothetical protein
LSVSVTSQNEIVLTIDQPNQLTFIVDQGVIGPTGPAGAAGVTGPTGAAGSGVELKGVVNNPGDLPMVGNQPGDTYVVLNP